MHYTNLGNRENKLDNSNHNINTHLSAKSRAIMYNEEINNSLVNTESKKK